MKAALITNGAEYYSTIKECVAKTYGVSNLVEDASNNKLIFEFTTHNVLEGLREKLLALGSVIEFIYL